MNPKPGKNPEVKQDAPKAAPEGAGNSAERANAADETASEATDVRGALVESSAGILTKVEAGLSGVQNEWSRLFHTIKKTLGVSEETMRSNPITRGMLLLIAMIAKAVKHMDSFGLMGRRIAGDLELQKEKMSDTEVQNAANITKELLNEKRKNFKTESKDIEVASTSYAASLLLGNANITDASVFAARLYNSKNAEGKSYFSPTDFSTIQKKGAPMGAVLIFTADKTNADKGVAISAGGGNFQYFDPRRGKVIDFKLGDTDSPIKDQSDLQWGLFPRFNTDPDWFKNNPQFLEPTVNRTIKSSGNVLADASKAIKDMQSPKNLAEIISQGQLMEKTYKDVSEVSLSNLNSMVSALKNSNSTDAETKKAVEKVRDEIKRIALIFKGKSQAAIAVLGPQLEAAKNHSEGPDAAARGAEIASKSAMTMGVLENLVKKINQDLAALEKIQI